MAIRMSFLALLCAALVAAATPVRAAEIVPDAMVAVQAEVAKRCKTAVYGEDFAESVDFNNDRQTDAIFNLGAVNCDGTHDLGVFWSRVLEWPLVWEEGEETAIQSPSGGSKLTWSGPPLMARETRERIAFELAAEGPADLARLLELGAGDLGGGRFLDPDGNAFTVLMPPL